MISNWNIRCKQKKNVMNLEGLPCIRVRTESDGIIGTGTGEGARSIIIGVAVSCRTRSFEKQGVRRWLASIRRCISSTAAILRFAKCFTSAFTGHILAVRGVSNQKLSRTGIVQVHNTASSSAIPSISAFGCHQHGKVIAVDEANIIKIQPASTVQGEFSQGGRRGCAATRTFHSARATVTGQASEFVSGRVLGAESATP